MPQAPSNSNLQYYFLIFIRLQAFASIFTMLLDYLAHFSLVQQMYATNCAHHSFTFVAFIITIILIQY